MKFIKSNLAKKLIIILIALMIFNIAIPKQVDAAWNFSGILMKPISSLILSFLVSIDVQLGLFMGSVDIVANGVGRIVEQITELADEGKLTTGEKVKGIASLCIGDLFIGPDTIFAGEVSLLNANIFDFNTNVELYEEDIEVNIGSGDLADAAENAAEGAVDDLGESVENAVTTVYYGGNFAGTLKRGIATTYVILRNICAMIMLAGLIFTGIRVLVTANTPTKMAQWRQLLQDWLIGMILLIFSHVLMYGIFWVSDTLTKALRDSLIGFGGLNFNLVKTCLTSFDSATQIICLVMLAYMIYLTVVFAVAYFKRLLWVCVLIVIAPIVSIMYAFGNQTKQIYSKWIREYVTTVLVQPFHLIVYYTLVSVPLNMVSAGTLEYTGLSTFQMIYALGAISFIRPAEKYIRELFGMNQGIANMASFDSGKQTLDAVGNAVKDVVKKAALVAATVATGGATAGALVEEGVDLELSLNGPRDQFPEFLDSRDPDWVDDPQSSPISRVPDRSEASLNEFLDTTFGEENPDNMEERAYMEAEMRTNGRYGDKFTEEQLQSHLDKMNLEEGSEERAEYEKMFRDAGHGEKVRELLPEDMRWTEERLQSELDNMGLEQGTEERAEMERELRAAGHGDNIEEVPENVEVQPVRESMAEEFLEDISQNSTEQSNTSTDSNNEAHKQSNINANNVIITAGNVSMQGNLQGDAQDITSDNINTVDDDNADDGNSEGEPDDKTDEEKEQEERESNDANTEIEEEGTPVSEKDGFLKRRLKELNAVTDFSKGESGIFESINKLSPNSMLRQMPDKINDSKVINKLREGKHGDKVEKIEETAKKSIDFLKAFEEVGGIKDLHAGFNNVRDTFFVGGAPGDWKTTNSRMDENLKANIDQVKFNIVNNEEFQNQIIIREKYEEKLRAQYSDKQKYPDARIREMAKDKAKEKLKSVTDTYVPLGVKDPIIMLELDEDRKKYGLSAENAVKQRIKYEKFNINLKNVQNVNEYFKTDNTTVEQTIPQARDYYNNGYTDVGKMNRAYELTEILNLTHDYGMKLDRVLSNKGSKINLNLDKRTDLDDKTKARVKTIIESYKKEDKE